jgi:hypothetical protein
MCVQFRGQLERFLGVKAVFDPHALLNPGRACRRSRAAPNSARCVHHGKLSHPELPASDTEVNHDYACRTEIRKAGRADVAFVTPDGRLWRSALTYRDPRPARHEGLSEPDCPTSYLSAHAKGR